MNGERTRDEQAWKVVVAESDAVRRIQLAEALRSSGMQVSVCGDGVELVELLESWFTPWGGGPDLVVADVRMPGIGGLELLEGLAMLGGVCPVVLISPDTDEKLKRRARRFGARAVVTEPFDVVDLVSLVRREVRRSRDWDAQWGYEEGRS